jgi:hypothetical protein
LPGILKTKPVKRKNDANTAVHSIAGNETLNRHICFDFSMNSCPAARLSPREIVKLRTLRSVRICPIHLFTALVDHLQSR